MDPSLLSAPSSSTLDGAVVTPYGTLQRAPAELAAFARTQTGSDEDEVGGMLGVRETGFGSEDEDDEDDEDDAPPSPPAKGKGKKRARASTASNAAGPSTAKKAKSEMDTATGRRKIRIEFIEDDSRRHITFSKRKAGIMKKAYELATLTGTQVLLLVVSQTGLVYTFTTPKLSSLVQEMPGKELIRCCIASDGDGDEGLPSPSGSSLQLGGPSSEQQQGEAQAPVAPPKPRAKGGEQMPRIVPAKRRATATRMQRGGSGNSNASSGSQHDQLASAASSSNEAQSHQQQQQYVMPLPLNYNFGPSTSMYAPSGSGSGGAASGSGAPMGAEQPQWAFDGSSSMLPPLHQLQQQQQHHQQQLHQSMQAQHQTPWSATTALDMASHQQSKQHAATQQNWGRGQV